MMTCMLASQKSLVDCGFRVCDPTSVETETVSDIDRLFQQSPNAASLEEKHIAQ